MTKNKKEARRMAHKIVEEMQGENNVKGGMHSDLASRFLSKLKSTQGKVNAEDINKIMNETL